MKVMPLQKLWGLCWPLLDDYMCYVDRIEVYPTGYCSRHRHANMCNQFTLLSGKLAIITYREGQVAIDHLNPGETFLVKPGIEHRFFSPGKSTALETYFCLNTPHVVPTRKDIERVDVGGILDSVDISPLLR